MKVDEFVIRKENYGHMCFYPVEVMNDISRVCVAEVGHGDTDLLVIFFQVNLYFLLQLL